MGRQIGLNRLAGRVLYGQSGYETRFQEKMLGAVSAGDCVWDVGANVGLYTRMLADAAGPSGAVVAFEPSPANFERLSAAMAGRENVQLLRMALGRTEGYQRFVQGTDPLGATSKIVTGDGRSSAATIQVETASGDQLVARHLVPPPNVVKIDTEGFELDVVEGLTHTLASPTLNTLCIELHFGLLDARGTPDAPADIENVLLCNGYRVEWADMSHIIASRLP